MFPKFIKLLYHADTITGTGAPLSPDLGKEDIYDILSADDDTKDEVINLESEKDIKDTTGKEKDDADDAEEDKESEKDDEDDELKAIEEELDEEKEPDEEKLDLITPVPRREILKKYPQLFKEFPYLEKAYYREQQFTEVHPTIEEARISKDKAEILDAYEGDIMEGNIEKTLKAIKTDEIAFAKLADNYLPALAAIDERAYHNVLGNIIKHTIMQMVTEGRNTQNEALQTAATILNQFTFGSSTFTPPTPLSKNAPVKDDSKERALTERENKINEQQYNRANTEVITRIENAFKSTIDQNIDPKQTMTPYVRKNAVREANETLKNLMEKDTRFKTIVARLWENAKKNDYNKESTDKIRSAHVSKAKTLLPSVIKKARNEALKGMGKRVVEDKEDNTETRVEKPHTSERSRSTNTRDTSSKIPEGMSTLDYFLSD